MLLWLLKATQSFEFIWSFDEINSIKCSQILKQCLSNNEHIQCNDTITLAKKKNGTSQTSLSSNNHHSSCLSVSFQPLYKLEALHLYVGGGEDGEIYENGLINFFKLPARNAEKFFPYNLKYLALLSAWGFRESVLKELGKRFIFPLLSENNFFSLFFEQQYFGNVYLWRNAQGITESSIH